MCDHLLPLVRGRVKRLAEERPLLVSWRLAEGLTGTLPAMLARKLQREKPEGSGGRGCRDEKLAELRSRRGEEGEGRRKRKEWVKGA